MKVFIEKSDALLDQMFEEEGMQLCFNPDEADLICFSGGEDVSPMLYEQSKHAYTHNNPLRDEDCCNLYYKFVGITPMVGICRGAQFLNVMCGGELFQHVNNHNKGQHEAVCTETGEIYNVTSAHHQMMIPSEEGEVLLVANETTERVFVERASVTAESLVGLPKDDIEAVFYEEEMCLCFQPHPEYVNKGDECYELFMTMMKENLGLEY